jgi:drug/metabolite transporter (DMT)-like permease
MKRAASVVFNDSLLLLTAVIWGLAFVAQRVGMEHVGPFTYNAVRFGIGSLCLLPLIAMRRSTAPVVNARSTAPAANARSTAPVENARSTAPAMSAVGAGLIAGAVLFVGASLQQVGLLTTTAGKAGFITGLYVVLVPLLGLVWGQRAGWSAWVGAVLSVAGLFLLSVTAALTIQRGDLLVLIGAFFWAGHVQVVGWLSRRTDPIRLSCVQFAVCSIASLAAAFLFEHPDLDGIFAAAWPILYGGFMSVGVAFTLQVVAQRHAPPAHAAILLSFETVVAALGGAVLLGERLAPRGVVGCAIIFAGMLISQAPLFMASLAGVRRRV